MATLRARFVQALTILSLFSWSASAWAQPCPGDGWLPWIRSLTSHAMAYDSARGVTVLFGGNFDHVVLGIDLGTLSVRCEQQGGGEEERETHETIRS